MRSAAVSARNSGCSTPGLPITKPLMMGGALPARLATEK